ncbi:MAG: DUF3822 family protein [Bacteroidetes bacterium]|nr:DUF3822 family protein [Bacteroidota bacterium]
MLGEYYKEKQVLTNKAVVGDAISLSLFISQSSFMFAVSSNNFKNVIQIGHVTINNTLGTAQTFGEKIVFLLNNYQLAQKKFEKVIVSVLNKDFTIVPEAYSNSNDLKEFLSFSSGIAEVKNPLAHTIKNVKFCYVFDNELVQALERVFSHAIIKHAGAINNELFFNNHSLINDNLFLTINDDLIEIAAKEKNDLLFYNVFNYENNEDILYYLLFMMEQFNLNPLQIKLVISGQVQTDDSLILSIKKYIKQVNFVVHNPDIKLDAELQTLPKHFYFTLLNQHLCVS